MRREAVTAKVTAELRAIGFEPNTEGMLLERVPAMRARAAFSFGGGAEVTGRYFEHEGTPWLVIAVAEVQNRCAVSYRNFRNFLQDS